MLPEQTSILIVGAGPAGLSAAISLFSQGCKDILIVDAVERSPDTSRAMAIHAATLEVVTMPAIISGFSLKLLQQALETIGCADKLVELGIKGETLSIWDRKAPILKFSIHKHLSSYTKYSYILLLSQSKTEEVLEEHLKGLGIEVQRPYKVVGMQGDVDEYGNTQVLFESGEVVKAQYVIGADGARSAVSIRHHLFNINSSLIVII
jgi:2-polyprenyl-6-methoxyphenol hydroxylase-like FAD-dependent oxidoreductase